MKTDEGPQDADHEALERELTMVRGAIRMVADGAYRSMTMGGLSHGQAVLDALGPDADQHGVELIPLLRADGGGPDVRARPRQPVKPKVVR